MWEATPHAAPPGTSQASHANFEVAEAGQLEKANSDKAGTHHIITVCETRKKQALERAQHRLKHWWQKIF